MDTSPFMKHVDTNYVPLDSELHQIKGLLSEPLEKLAGMDVEIEQVRRLLETLSTERSLLSYTIQKHRTLLSPFRRLPSEVLQVIFDHCIPTGRNAVISFKEAPLLLTQVCSSWRSIALSTPSIWASIHISLPLTGRTVVPYYAEENWYDNWYVGRVQEVIQARYNMVECWLKRSGVCPLSISLYKVDEGNRSSPNDSRPIVDLLMTYSRRWRSLELIAGCHDVEPMLEIPPDEVPLLKRVHFDNSKMVVFENSRRMKGNETLFAAPQLTEVSLTLPNEDCLNLPLRLSTLTHFSKLGSAWDQSGNFTVRKATTLLLEAYNLVAFSFDIHNFHSEVQHTLLESVDSISLPRLKALAIKESSSAIPLIERLDIPSIRHVTFYSVYYSSSIQRTSLVLLLKRCSGVLKSLTTDLAHMPAQVVLSCLRLVPQLEELHIHSSPMGMPYLSSDGHDNADGVRFLQGGIDNVVLKHMTVSDGRECLIPRLAVFEHCTSNLEARTKFSDAALLKFVKSRVEPSVDASGGSITQLRRVSSMFHRSQELDIEQQLSSFIEAGLKLDLKYTPQTISFGTPYDGLPKTGLV